MSVRQIEYFDNDEAREVLTIAIMGPTGTGKTSFINLLSGSSFRVGREMESCTIGVQTTEPVDFEGRQITFIDTPGFDDTTINDADVLAMIAAHLTVIHQHGKPLAGVIYMHRILDNRIGGISSRNFRMFRKLCGDSTLRNVVIVTNMWDQIDHYVGQIREQELIEKDIFFKPALDKGASIARHDGSMESGQAILRVLLRRQPGVLQIQSELGSGLDISETSAGQELNRDMMERIARHQEEVRALMAEIDEASKVRDLEARRELDEERAKLQADITRIQRDSRNLVTGYKEAITRLESRIKQMENVGRSTRANEEIQETTSRSFYDEGRKKMDAVITADSAVFEAKIASALPVVGFWGRLAVILSPFSFTWK